MSTPEPFDPHETARGFATTWERIVTAPRAFFAQMPETGGLRDPLVFLAICAGINAVGRGIVALGLRAAVGSFVLQVAGTFVVAALLVVIAQQLFGGRAGFEATFRAVAYAAAPTVLAWVPRVGILATIYAWFLVMPGLERVQGFDTTKAVLAVLLAILVAVVAGGALLTGLR